MMSLFGTLKFIYGHPLAGKNLLASTWSFLKWQALSRTFNAPVVYPFVEDSKLIVERGMTGATGNIYAGLHEFEDMMFLLHLLRPWDYFVDAGANIGSYTILASSVAGAQSISFEPVPSTFSHLKHNVSVNNLESRVELHNCGIGNVNGELSFTGNLDTVNHVIPMDGTNEPDSIRVKIKTIDEFTRNKIPLLMKIDVEGFELAVLQGARQTIENDGLKAMIVELNGSCRRYGVNESDIHTFLLNAGFTAAVYEPFDRKLKELDSYNPHSNTIYFRDASFVQKRLERSKRFRVLNRDI
jgi:FkbM family methyltransferase